MAAMSNKDHISRLKRPKWLLLHFLLLLVAVAVVTLLLAEIRLATVTVIFQDAIQFMDSINFDMPFVSNTSTTKTTTLTAKTPTKPFVLDFLSVGSRNRQQFQDAQNRTFGSHPYVRNFFTASEVDDADPDCAKVLTKEQVKSIAEFCRSKPWAKQQFLMRELRSYHATPRGLGARKNPAGWLCAQRRPIFGLSKAIRQYRKEGVDSLPDFFIIMDDDTYYNVPLLRNYMKDMDPDVPMAMAGCIIRANVQTINFTFPYGGFGTIFSREALRRLMMPISCRPPRPADNDFVRGVCRRMRQNQIGEKQLFRNGMSLSDLMEAYAQFEPYAASNNWTAGYCFHSDWIWGFLVNFYNLANHVSDPEYANVPHARLEGYMGSERSQGNIPGNQCQYDSVKYCTNESHICHYQTPMTMADLTDPWLTTLS